MIGLVFILNHGAFVRVALPQDKALEIIRQWSEGAVDGKICLPDPPPGHQAWAIDAKAIMAIHTETPQQQQLSQQQPTHHQTTNPRWRSG